ncbi:MAG TPA: shikimate dehydrogenase [Desulfuromonadaceae bacterium]|jgi:shikimate dehydrogenase
MNYIKGTTKVLAIIGHPVEHSCSPAMQNAALLACGLDYIYVPFKVEPEHLAQAVSGLRSLGVVGFNVTIPHKVAIMAHLDGFDESAEAAGAVNTVINRDGHLIGYNTDGDGVVKSLREDLGFIPGEGTTIVVVGAGGAARGAVAAFCRKGTGTIIIVNRSQEKAQALARSMGERYCNTKLFSVSDPSELRTCFGSTSLIINTTSLGMNNEEIPYFKLSDVPDNTMVYDMVYSPPVTPFLRDAEQRALRCANGLGMLAAQGELSFRLWTGVEPPPGIMKSVLEAVISS